MNTVTILINCPSRYKINRKLAREVISQTILDCGLRRLTEIGLMVVGDRKMRFLNRTYRQIDQPTPILAFPFIKAGERFYYPPTKTLYLGELVVSYPQLIKRATGQNVLVDTELTRLLKHALKHLLGINSDPSRLSGPSQLR